MQTASLAEEANAPAVQLFVQSGRRVEPRFNVCKVALAKHLFAILQLGLMVLIPHPAVDTPNLRAITPNWPSRVANCETCQRLNCARMSGKGACR
ncbi:MAG: hypothetical protein KJZ93_23830 [Caldilineaceae bacterium]|nr:hypothetical protein [Caldilineaceae bacterium]